MKAKSGQGFFRLPRNVVLLGWTSFFTDAGSEMILPVLPLFLKGVLGASMASIGMIEGIAEATANGLRLGSGFFADRIGRSKPFVYAGYGLSTLVKPLLALAPTWHFVLGVRFVDRVGKGLRSAPRDAIVAASTPRPQFGKAFGYHRAMDTAGAMVGSLIAAIALWWMGGVAGHGVRWLFALSFIPCATALLCIGPVKEPPRLPVEKHARNGHAKGVFHLSAAARILLAGVALWELGNISYAFILLRLADLGIPDKYVPAIYFGYNVIYMLVAMPLGHLADRIGIKVALLLAPLLGAASFWTLGLSAGWAAALGGMALYAGHSAVVNLVPRAAVAHFAHARGRGTLFGLIGVCALLGNTLGGLLWDRLGSAFLMHAAALASLLAILPFLLLPKSTAKN